MGNFNGCGSSNQNDDVTIKQKTFRLVRRESPGKEWYKYPVDGKVYILENLTLL